MEQVKPVEEKLLDCDMLFNKLKNQLITKMSMTEQAANEQAERISAIFREAQVN